MSGVSTNARLSCDKLQRIYLTSKNQSKKHATIFCGGQCGTVIPEGGSCSPVIFEGGQCGPVMPWGGQRVM